VDAALAWLARHQDADGSWDYKKYGGGGKIWDSGSREGITAVALLAFLGAGHTEKIGRYKNNVRATVKWLMSKQRADGGWGVHRKQEYEVYEAALSTLALSESYAMARNAQVGAAAQKGVDHLVSKQEADGSWPHRPWKSTSSMGWFVMALKSAKVAGLKVPNQAFANALKYLESIAEKDADGYYGKVPYAPNKNYFCHKGESMTAVGMVCFLFLGAGNETHKQASMLAEQPPQWTPGLGLNGPPQNFYHWYYATLGLFQCGGDPWKVWNQGLKSALLPSQCKGGPKDGSLQDVDGSWDPVTLWSKIGGRVWTTAMGALCLEVYYRYLPMYR
jgi:prenyltransferase beta subunit